MTYAGIGSRQTPQEVLDKMTEVAKYLDNLGYTLQTGFTFKNKETNLDEEGADKAFSDGSKNKILFGPYGIRKTVKGIVSADTYNEAVTEKSSAIVKEVHPAPDRLSPGAIKLMARNTNQIFGKDLSSTVDFVLFYAKETSNPLRPAGGTGQAVEMARRKGIPTINMADTNWRDQLKTALANKPTQSSTSAPIREELEGLTEARKVYESLFIATGKPPITFTVDVSTWKLNKNFNYDLIDQDTGEVLLANVNMVTGIIEKDAVEYTILTRKQLNDYIKDFEEKVVAYNLDELLAMFGINIKDVYKKLNQATTTEDLIEIETEINRKLCQ
jgi:hypothetical protein